MKLLVNNLRLPYYGGLDELRELAAKKLGVGADELESLRIVKESIDARRKPDVSRVYSVCAGLPEGRRIRRDDNVRPLAEQPAERLQPGGRRLGGRPVIVGSGPAGMFAGLVLAEYGYRPLILERGADVEERTAAVRRFWETGLLDPETNVQFGEGGAGTFSDGKLTTRINDRRCERVLREFHVSGAGEDILYKAKPHIGSDVLKHVVAEMRRRIVGLGGEVRFHTKMTALETRGGRVTGITANGNEKLDAEVLVLAIGHSARDTFADLLGAGVRLVRKPFSIGVRIEHPQDRINRSQYGREDIAAVLGAADYQLFHKIGDRTAYSFCMCPGGIVVAAASEQGMIVTNGMSEYARDGENANSAFVVSVEPEDFGSSHPLAGVEFQRRWEAQAFAAAGMDGSAPVQRLGDFMDNRASTALGSVRPSYTGKVALADINACLPGFVTEAMRGAAGNFDRRLKGFAMRDAVLTGVETRTSSPVRLPRGTTLEAEGIEGLYPAGEGAGYAGGIVSAAVDGIRVAEQIIRTYRRP
jgi:uncharacterized FAD-dependent dehydrogenase